ncbi:hypothetical protein DP144_13945 [Clostridium tetani]|uniref:hypothetical protein n=1 Tax=Clostridium tetani TaxID=1513 RepID=UPI00100A9C3A|nr:hypothetical protein [Clostridium tetani]RXM73689.1 hypothetical protein DP154_13765 [Clostridium tetani]RYU97804.1 hypothetical protein DP144_13945 [Clostridium tetani]
MQITYRQYPHPVLNYFENDYKKGSFFSEIDQKVEGKNIKLSIAFKLNSNSLLQLIKTKQAAYVVHIECKGTRYRKKIDSYDDKIEIIIDGNKVNYELEVCIMVVAKTNINNFKSNEFKEEFKGIGFNIGIGDVLAIDRNIKIDINKTGDSFKNVPSIFSIVIDNKNHRCIKWDESGGDKILIKLSKDNFIRYKSISNSKHFSGALAMMIVIPVLTEIISNMQQEMNCYEDCMWFKVIENRLKVIGLYDEQKLSSKYATEIAYLILDGLLDKSLICIEEFFQDEGE